MFYEYLISKDKHEEDYKIHSRFSTGCHKREL